MLLIGCHHSFIFHINQLLNILSIFNAIFLQQTFKEFHSSSMLCHISSQYKPNNPFPKDLILIPGDVFQKVHGFLIHNPKEFCCMEELLHCHVVAVDGTDGDGVDVVAVGHTVVTEVVADCGKEEGEGIELVETELLQEITGLQHVVAHLEDVRTVDVVVVLHIMLVGCGDAIEKESNLLFIYKLL